MTIVIGPKFPPPIHSVIPVDNLEKVITQDRIYEQVLADILEERLKKELAIMSESFSSAYDSFSAQNTM